MTAPDLEPHRRELQVHCYRMLASYHEAEDAVQETFIRALRGWDSFDKRAFRAWLYRIATNVCLDMIRKDARQLTKLDSFAEVTWLQPFPDRMLPTEEEPDSIAVRRETIELAFVATMQLLPARQRAVFVARDVLGWSAKETAAMLEISVAAATSALQRARVTMQQNMPERTEWSTSDLNDEERNVLTAFIDAHERYDVQAMVSIAAKDLRITMPPYAMCWQGLDEIEPRLRRAFVDEPDGDWRLVPTMANRMPTAASYLREPGDTQFRIFKFDILRVEHGKIVEITTFGPAAVIDAFDLPRILGDDQA